MVILLDTNIIIDHLRQPAGIPTILKILITKYGKESLYISVITIQELYAGASTRDTDEITKLVRTIKHLNIYQLTHNIARLAGTLTRDLSRSITFADAGIAATAIHYHAKLATKNTKDFVDIKGLELLTL